MHLFYTPDLTENALTYSLNEEESKHCTRVLRLGKEDSIALINGKGLYGEAIIVDDTPKRSVVKLIKMLSGYGKRNHSLHIAIAPTKNIDRIEWFLEKSTEIGIDEITPLICEHSERKEVKTDRLNKVIIAAMKQSQTAYLPQLNEAVKLADFVSRPIEGHKMMAHCLEDQEKVSIHARIKPHQSYTILIGPEGDFSPSEIKNAMTNQFQPVSLGASRLRTETAALYACFEINYLNRV